jgi:hypothetical protein
MHTVRLTRRFPLPHSIIEDRPRMPSLHLLLVAQTVVVVLTTLNRRTSLALASVPPHEFLRWVEVGNLALGLAGLLVSYGLIARLGVLGTVRGLIFLTGAFLISVSYGDHEVTNYLNSRFCPPAGGTASCEIIRFHDEEFSHLLFFAGFTVINIAVMAAQWAHPVSERLRTQDRVLIGVNALFVAAGIVANLAFEEIGYDLVVVAVVAVAAIDRAVRRRGQPILQYYAIAYTVGLIATAALKI